MQETPAPQLTQPLPGRPPLVIKNLQILRFLAASLILFEHAQYEAITKPYLDAVGYKILDFFFWPGGVDIFFVISGFIMYTIGRQSFGKPGAAGQFLLRRIVRIVPSYWFFTGLMVLAAFALKDSVSHGAMSGVDIVRSILFIPYVNAYGTYYPVLSLGWTLNYEIFFYALFALALAFNRSTGLRLIAGALCLIGLLGMTGWVTISVVEFWFNSIVIEFAFGIGLGWLYQKGTRLPVWAGLGLFAIGVLLVIVAKHFKLDITALDYRAVWLGLPALMMAAGLVFIERPETNGPVMRVLVFGGNISFALYLSHPFAINIMGLIFGRLGLSHIPLFIVASMIAALIGAALFYLLFEKPVTAFLNARLRRSKTPQPIDSTNKAKT